MTRDQQSSQSTRSLEDHIEDLRGAEKEARRRLERGGGIALMVVSVILSVVFLVMLRVSAKSLIEVLIAVFFLVISLILFGRGIRDAVFGRNDRPS